MEKGLRKEIHYTGGRKDPQKTDRIVKRISKKVMEKWASHYGKIFGRQEVE